MSALKVRSTADLLAEQIRHAISEGEIAPGEQLHQEHLAARFGVSRSPIREALRLLEAEGLIVYHSNKGAVVASLSVEEVREIFEMRELLEAALVRHACQAMDPKTLRAIKELLAVLRRETDPSAWLRRRRELYEMLYRPARRPRMVAVVFAHQIRISDTPYARRAVTLFKESFEANHRDLIRALEARDGDAAAAAISTDIEKSKDTIITLMEEPVR